MGIAVMVHPGSRPMYTRTWNMAALLWMRGGARSFQGCAWYRPAWSALGGETILMLGKQRMSCRVSGMLRRPWQATNSLVTCHRTASSTSPSSAAIPLHQRDRMTSRGL